MPHVRAQYLMGFAIAALWGTTALSAAERPNVLFIAVDDLRPEIGCYGAEVMQTPNLDRLAERSVIFTKAYCNVPVCGASRASLMTGLRPTPKRFRSYLTRADKDAPDVPTLAEHFRNNGYRTATLGKIFHHADDSPESWTHRWWPEVAERYALEKSRQIDKSKSARRSRGAAYESAEVADDFYKDGKIAIRAVEGLGEFSDKPEPFFFAVGFYKPHLPFVAPQKYWETYREADNSPQDYFVPKNAPKVAIHSFGELRAYAGIPLKGPVSSDMADKLVQGYRACVGYTDRNVGVLLDELDRLNLSENTIIVLWGDHGWNLGEHTLWCKHSCFETSMRVPLYFSAPMSEGVQSNTKSESIAEFVDIYPTLCDLAELPKPNHLQGTTLLPTLRDPDATVKDYAVGRYPRGETVTDGRYRFTSYRDKKGREIANMLYDHRTDPGENLNVAKRPENSEVVKQLRDVIDETLAGIDP
ncbi:sulfatase [Stratiformator vulcanicus]|uniref:Choline-sulfatase n=1 Tax=Stratiformator vulcanicus TaxID=2527980 RepID=A0A517R5P0_9PLAN|nr:sulfatase [Stratiformator vulcanicus]QDT39192.1 Choline-sulfatase [Stratiformator vulcanicus]